ncbi:hypothetical protein [Vibrio ostreicida]|nr:hypothetical protein [Vibrio ostreicida]
MCDYIDKLKHSEDVSKVPCRQRLALVAALHSGDGLNAKPWH